MTKIERVFPPLNQSSALKARTWLSENRRHFTGGMNGLHFSRVTPQTFESVVRSFVLSASSAVVRSDLMQLWESEFVYVPKCLHCHGRPRMHRHGKCKRTGSDGLPRMLQRYRCPLCLRTCSILKDGMLPYRRVSAERLQSCLDNPQELQVEPDSKPVRSAVKRFQQRTRRIVMVLGALLRLPLGLTASELNKRLWEELRRVYGDAATILRELASSFDTSLLHDYRCLIRPTPKY